MQLSQTSVPDRSRVRRDPPDGGLSIASSRWSPRERVVEPVVAPCVDCRAGAMRRTADRVTGRTSWPGPGSTNTARPADRFATGGTPMTDVARPRQDVQAVHRRRLRRGRRRADAEVVNPANDQVIAHVPASADGGRRPRRRGRREGVRDVEADDAAGPLAAAAQARRPPRGQGRRARPAREPERRQAGRRGDRRDDGLRRPVPLLRRRGTGHGRPGRQRVRGRPHLDHPARPDRRRGLDRAVELPAVHGHLEARTGARDRQHRRSSSRPPGRR